MVRSRNKQPWYHEVELLFTTTDGRYLSAKQINEIKAIVYKAKGVVEGTVEVMETEADPGDPADLM